MDFPIPSRFQRQLLATLRIVTALLFLEHGMMKLFDFPAAQAPGPLPPLLVLAALIEIATSILILLGLFTRAAAFVASGEMAVAYFMAHFPKSFWPGVNMGMQRSCSASSSSIWRPQAVAPGVSIRLGLPAPDPGRTNACVSSPACPNRSAVMNECG